MLTPVAGTIIANAKPGSFFSYWDLGLLFRDRMFEPSFYIMNIGFDVKTSFTMFDRRVNDGLEVQYRYHSSSRLQVI